MSRVEVTIAGVGGQGSILAGQILGAAAVMYDGKYAAQTQAYSSELRGGFAAAWLIISENPVVFTRVTHPDVLVAQAQDSITRFASGLKPAGTLIIDSDMVTEPPGGAGRLYRVAATTISRNRLNAPMTANMVILGAFCRVTEVVSREALEKAIRDSVPQGKDKINLEAFDAGYRSVAG